MAYYNMAETEKRIAETGKILAAKNLGYYVTGYCAN